MTQDRVDFILAQWAKERPELDTSAIGVIGRISRSSRYIDQHLTKNFAKFGLNQGEFDVLATLRRYGSSYLMTPSELLNALMLSSGAMTNRLDRLEQSGYIERKAHPEDRRGVLVVLTEEGTKKIDEVVIAHTEFEKELLASLTTAEQKQLASLTRKLLLSFGDDV
ncbi:MAG: MarR family winged helix-turn-helix transcriptional regulator [Anaerolineae bacterium]